MSTKTLQGPKKKTKSPLPSTKAELYAVLDEAERQFEAGEYVTNDEVMRWIDNELLGLPQKCRQSDSSFDVEL